MSAPINNDLLTITKRMKTNQEQLSILSGLDWNPFDRLVSEQDIAEATRECKMIDFDEEDEIGIVF